MDLSPSQILLLDGDTIDAPRRPAVPLEEPEREDSDRPTGRMFCQECGGHGRMVIALSREIALHGCLACAGTGLVPEECPKTSGIQKGTGHFWAMTGQLLVSCGNCGMIGQTHKGPDPRKGIDE